MREQLHFHFLHKCNKAAVAQAIASIRRDGNKKIKSVTVSIFPPPVCHEVMGPDAMVLVF